MNASCAFLSRCIRFELKFIFAYGTQVENWLMGKIKRRFQQISLSFVVQLFIQPSCTKILGYVEEGYAENPTSSDFQYFISKNIPSDFSRKFFLKPRFCQFRSILTILFAKLAPLFFSLVNIENRTA